MSGIFELDNLFFISKILPELKSKPWVDHLDRPPENACKERRYNQMLIAEFLFANFRTRKTTFARFLNDLDDCIDESSSMSKFELVARAEIEKSEVPDRKFLKRLDKILPMDSTPSLFEVLVRSSTRMQLPKRRAVGGIPHPEWLKATARLFAREAGGKTKTEIANKVKSQINAVTRRPMVVSALVIENLLKEKRVK